MSETMKNLNDYFPELKETTEKTVVEKTTFPSARQEVYLNDKWWEIGDGPEKVPEDVWKNFIKKNLYINWKPAGDSVDIKLEWDWYTYKIWFTHEFKDPKWDQTKSFDGSRRIRIDVKLQREHNNISMIYGNKFLYGKDENSQIARINVDDSQKDFYEWTIGECIEINQETHRQYEVVSDNNTKRMNFDIVYNDFETEKKIKSLIEGRSIKETPVFVEQKEDESWEIKTVEWIEELENTQLNQLDHPTLWKEVFNENGNYYRELFYPTSIGWKSHIAKIYFTSNWKFDNEKTKCQFNTLEKDVDFDITENNGKIEFSIKSKDDLINKVKDDRDILTKFASDVIGASPTIFPWLKTWYKVKDGVSTLQIDTKILSLDPVLWIYSIKLNEKDLLYCKVKDKSVVLVDEAWNEVKQRYINREGNNYYKVFKKDNKLNIGKNEKWKENPEKKLPVYKKWDANAIKLLKHDGVLTEHDGKYLNYYDNEWVLIAKMPYDKLKDWSYKFNPDNYKTRIEAQKLYRYSWFNNDTKKIKEMCNDLWVSDVTIQEIFKSSLLDELKKNQEDFDQNAVEIRDSKTGESVYYTLDDKFQIEKKTSLYEKAQLCINLMKKRLEQVQNINARKLIRENEGKKALFKNNSKYDNFEYFIWWDAGFWKQIPSQENLKEFISWKTNKLTVVLSRWKSESKEITYTVKGNDIESELSSWEEVWKITILNQKYTVRTVKQDRNKPVELWEDKESYTIKKGDIIFNQIEEED